MEHDCFIRWGCFCCLLCQKQCLGSKLIATTEEQPVHHTATTLCSGLGEMTTCPWVARHVTELQRHDLSRICQNVWVAYEALFPLNVTDHVRTSSFVHRPTLYKWNMVVRESEWGSVGVTLAGSLLLRFLTETPKKELLTPQCGQRRGEREQIGSKGNQGGEEGKMLLTTGPLPASQKSSHLSATRVRWHCHFQTGKLRPREAKSAFQDQTPDLTRNERESDTYMTSSFKNKSCWNTQVVTDPGKSVKWLWKRMANLPGEDLPLLPGWVRGGESLKFNSLIKLKLSTTHV